MIIVMKAKALLEELQEVLDTIKDFWYQPYIIYGAERTVIGALGSERGKDKLLALETLPGVERVVPILQPYKLARREVKREKSGIVIDNTSVVMRLWLLPVRVPLKASSRLWKQLKRLKKPVQQY
jgi:3-deoxy-7-phosphoheptulonate synthase